MNLMKVMYLLVELLKDSIECIMYVICVIYIHHLIITKYVRMYTYCVYMYHW